MIKLKEEKKLSKAANVQKKLSKASQEWLWTDADQNDWLSDSSYLFPIQRILQNEVMIARTEANSLLDLG